MYFLKINHLFIHMHENQLEMTKMERKRSSDALVVMLWASWTLDVQQMIAGFQCG